MGRKRRINTMRTLRPELPRRLAAAALLACAAVAAAGPAETTSECRVAAHLRDGSTIVGVLATNTIAIRTTYAQMDISLGAVNGFTFNDDRESVQIDFRNGDRLQGVIVNPAFVMSTLMGRISVGSELLASMDMVRTPKLPATLNRGLLAHYAFDGSLDNTCNHKRAASATVESKYVWGIAGRARAFVKGAQTDLVRIPNVCTGMQHTVSFWASVDNPGTHNSLFLINRGSNWPQADLWIFTSQGRLALVHAGRDMRRQNGRDPRKEFTDSGPVEPKKACHIVYTFKDGTAKYYLNGKPYVTYTGLPQLPVSADKAELGASRGPGRYYYQLSGWVDDLRIYARALSSTEIATLHAAYSPPSVAFSHNLPPDPGFDPSPPLPHLRPTN